MNRRNFLTTSSKLGAAVMFGIFSFTGCNKKNNDKDTKTKDPCNDLSGLSKEDIALRESYKYVDKTPFPDKNCKNCEFWIEPEEGKQCGTCDLFEGPIHAKGYCDGWSEA